MELDQNFFSFLLKFKKKRSQLAFNKKKEILNFIEFNEVKDSLAFYASAIFGLPIELRETDDYPYISGNKVFVPSFLALAATKEQNRKAYQLLILHLYAISLLVKPSKTPDDLLVELSKMYHLIPKAREFLINEFPFYFELQDDLTNSWSTFEKRVDLLNKENFKKAEHVGFDKLSLWGRLPRIPNFIESSNFQPETREALPEGTTERTSNAKGQIKKIELEEEKENIGQDVFHHFEKIETAEEYKGIQRTTDGADELEAHADALDELNLEDVVRTSQSAKSIYKTNLDMGFEVADLKEEFDSKTLDKVFYYDEWDEKKRSYKKDWCRIIHSREKNTKDIVSRPQSLLTCLLKRQSEVSKLKKKLIQLTSEVQIRKKLFSGPQIDIDNVVRNTCLKLNGGSGDQRYYQESKKRHRDMACILLVDTSLSSDSWVQNKRVLDVCLEALLIFGEASKDLGDPIMVAGFNSNTRHECKFIEWKSFEEPWKTFTSYVDSIAPSGYTRIGPAIRHATQLLEDRKERHKLLLIFTDGRPTDFDRYEGSYGLSDVRQAIRESDRSGVVTFALTVDPAAKQFLPNLFGLGNFQILYNMESLPEMLSKLYAKMAKRI